MTVFRLFFAGQIKKAEHRAAGTKAVVEVSICKKNRTKEGEPDVFTWIRATIWEPPEFMAPKLVKGSFIAGSGEMTARSYEGKDGKAFSIDVSCRSFDVEVSDGSSPAPSSAPVAQKPALPAPSDVTSEDPPF